MRRKLTILLAILFVAFVGLGVSDLRNHQVELNKKEIKLQDTNIELNKLKLEKQRLNDEFEKATQEKDVNEERVKQLEQEKLELERRYKELEISKAAEKERQVAASRLQNTSGSVAGASTRHNITGTKEDWLRASGIPENQWWAVDSIVSRESSWRPDAINPSSGACGLAQALPCSNLPCSLSDPVCHLKWQYSYVTARYGGYAQAVAFWNINHWY